MNKWRKLTPGFSVIRHHPDEKERVRVDFEDARHRSQPLERKASVPLLDHADDVGPKEPTRLRDFALRHAGPCNVKSKELRKGGIGRECMDALELHRVSPVFEY